MSWINNPHLWDENIPSPLGAGDWGKFQSHLDSIVGVEPDGTKRWRLVWGQDPDVSLEWNRYARRWEPRYRWKPVLVPTMNHATGIIEQRTEWICVPRFFIEALIPKVRRNEEAEAAGVDPDGERFTERRVLGNDYATMIAICEHDRKKDNNGWRRCCLERQYEGLRCFGRYRPPDEFDIETLREDFHVRVTSKLCRPDEQLADRDKAFLYSAWMLDQARENKRVQSELDYSRKHILSTLLPWRSNGYIGSRKNRFSIPGL